LDLEGSWSASALPAVRISKDVTVHEELIMPARREDGSMFERGVVRSGWLSWRPVPRLNAPGLAS